MQVLSKPQRRVVEAAVLTGLAAALCSVGACLRPPQSTSAAKPPTALPDPPARVANAREASQMCVGCHGALAEGFARDAHAADDFQCVVCHGPSLAHVSQETEGARPDRAWRCWIDGAWVWRMDKATLQIGLFCASCHGQPTAKEERVPQIDWRLYLKTRHGKAVVKGEPDAPGCTDCHAAHATSSEPWTDEQVFELCDSCHKKETADFKAGKHHYRLYGLFARQSNCLPCHRPH